MHHIKLPIVLFLFVFLCFKGTETNAAWDAYMQPSERDLANTLLGFQGVNLTDDDAIRDYAKLIYCKKYINSYGNDFKWNATMEEIRQTILRERSFAPRRYEIVAPVKLARYDFDKQAFPLEEKSMFKNVTSLTIWGDRRAPVHCGDQFYSEFFPQYYGVYFRTPLNISSIFVTPEKGQAFLQRLTRRRSPDRVLYLRMRLNITGYQSHAYIDGNTAILAGEVASIDVFEDPNLTIYFSSISDL